MRILAIETSCDETAVALLDISGPKGAPKIEVLGNSLFSQAHLHAEYGGVYPNLAKREHTKNLPVLLKRTLETANASLSLPRRGLGEVWRTIDYICVTQGPGLEPALWVGITFAEELGRKWGKPVVPVDHMTGHIWSVLYVTGNSKSQETNPKQIQNSNNQNSKLEMPAIALLVSGGHTELVLIKDFGQYEILGKTRDDAVGEAFDKVARMLGLGYPGGPAISAMAEIARNKRQETNLIFPRPMINSNDLDFSYSGLKTAVLYYVKKHPPQTDSEKAEIARAFEDSAIEVLIEKTRKAIEQNPETKTLIVGGGVAANKLLQNKLRELIESYPQVTLHMPEASLSTDNAIMIGIAGFIRIEEGGSASENITARGNMILGG